MRIVGTWQPAEITPVRSAKAREALLAAYESGYTLFDHADIYCRGACEEHHGMLLRDSPELRRQTLIATKCGIRFRDTPSPGDPGRYDFSKDWIIASCEGSLQRLGVERIDLYQLHRPDMLMQPAEVAEAFDSLHSSGKVRWFGVSNFLPSQVALLKSFVRQPLIVNQVEISLARLACFEDGTLDQCIRHGIAPLSWGPLGGGREWPESVGAELKRLADRYSANPAQIALAWLMKHPSGIVPIVGTVSPERIRDAVHSAEVELSREDWYSLFVAARGEPMP